MDRPQPPAAPDAANPNPSGPSRRRRWTLAGLAGAAVAAVGAFTWQRQAGAHGFGRHHWHDMDPEAMGRRIDAMVGWVLADVAATPDQKERIATIAKGLANDVAPLRAQHAEAKRRALELLSAPTIDRARIERLRVEHLQLADSASRRLVQGIADAADVLNAEQRAQLVARWRERHAWRHGR